MALQIRMSVVQKLILNAYETFHAYWNINSKMKITTNAQIWIAEDLKGSLIVVVLAVAHIC